VIDVTAEVAAVVGESGVRTGLVNVSGIGSTLGITTLEFEPGCVADLQRALDRVAPATDDYAHNARWGDHNGFAHLRSALVGTTRTFTVQDGGLVLGAWQQIVFCDFDDRARRRAMIVTVIGD
jgi:secondary thiamine-phosphate synthase enzyme